MEKTMVHELKPVDSHKSFYGKAKVVCDGFFGTRYLQSYETIVASVSYEWTVDSNGQRDCIPVFHRHWDGWSATTGRHIAAFCESNGTTSHSLPVVHKKDWDKLPVEPVPEGLLQPFNWKGVNVNYGLPYWAY